MSANAILRTEIAEGWQESLAERIARSPLRLADSLDYAAQIAGALRDLHVHGLIYGAVSSQLILLGPAGASLQQTGDLKHLGDARCDVSAFGAVLEEMLRKEDIRDHVPQELWDAARALGAKCRDAQPDMLPVMIRLRLLRLKVRQVPAGARRPVLVKPAAPAPARTPEPWYTRLSFSFSLRPFAGLVTSCLPGK